MRILLVNNSGGLSTLLASVFAPHDVTIVPWNGLRDMVVEDFDFAVLSGSSNFPVVGNEESLRVELEIIRAAKIPILGICYGFELIVVAFGGSLKMLPMKERGVLHMELLGADPLFDGIEDLFVYEGHHWSADAIPDVLIPLAKSSHGTEAVKHKDHLLYGVQFHPEKLEHETAGARIIENFIGLVEQGQK